MVLVLVQCLMAPDRMRLSGVSRAWSMEHMENGTLSMVYTVEHGVLRVEYGVRSMEYTMDYGAWSILWSMERIEYRVLGIEHGV